MEEMDLTDEVPLEEPEAPDDDGDVIPSEPEAGEYEMADMDPMGAGDIMDFGEKVEPLELPDRPLSPDQLLEVGDLTGERIRILDKEISEVYDQVREEVGANESIVNECYNWLLKARDIVLRKEVTRVPQAEYYVEQARARLIRAAASRKGARRNAWWIILWGLIWAIIYVFLLIVLSPEYIEWLLAQARLQSTGVDPTILLTAMVWGGMGGVVAIWWHLFKHVSQRDFDSSYNISYLGKPFFGLILGATVYMVVFLFIAALGIQPGGDIQNVGDLLNPAITPWIIYLAAWACGFKENRIFGMVDRLMKSIFSKS